MTEPCEERRSCLSVVEVPTLEELRIRAMTLGNRQELLETLRQLSIRASLLGYPAFAEALACVGLAGVRGLDFELQQLLSVFSPFGSPSR